MTLLKSERLTLRPWTMDDAEVLFSIRRLEEVAKWLGSPEPWESVEFAREKVTEWTDMATQTLGVLAIVPDGVANPVGSVALARAPNSPEVEIGWWLHPDAAGNGWATEASAALLGHAWAGDLPRVWALMWPDNDPSAAVAKAIGMRHFGVLVDPWYGTPEFPWSRMFCAHNPAVFPSG